MNGIELIAQERQRQIDEEGWSAEHDDEHETACLAVAAACYALHSASEEGGQHETWLKRYRKQAGQLWPFDEECWKPSNSIRNLVKAGALIAAEIDRLRRSKAETSSD